MFFTVYVSSAIRLLGEEELVRILEVSRRNNARDDITGMLLYKDGNFMQFLEGPKPEVCALLDRIRGDARHHGMIILLQDEHAEREFGDWSMGFQTPGSSKMASVPGYDDFLDLPLTSERFLAEPSLSLRLLMAFRENIR
jgi:hypothetical protein